MSALQTAEAAITSVFSKVNVPALIAAAQSLAAAWPDIEPQLAADVTELPVLIADIQKALSGATPTDADWAALDATLDANDQTIADQGAKAQAQIDAENGGK